MTNHHHTAVVSRRAGTTSIEAPCLRKVWLSFGARDTCLAYSSRRRGVVVVPRDTQVALVLLAISGAWIIWAVLEVWLG